MLKFGLPGAQTRLDMPDELTNQQRYAQHIAWQHLGMKVADGTATEADRWYTRVCWGDSKDAGKNFQAALSQLVTQQYAPGYEPPTMEEYERQVRAAGGDPSAPYNPWAPAAAIRATEENEAPAGAAAASSSTGNHTGQKRKRQ